MPRIAPRNNNVVYSPKVSDRKLDMSLNPLSAEASLLICRSSLGQNVYKYKIENENGSTLYEAVDVSGNFPKAASIIVLASKEGEYICELKSAPQLRGKSLQIERRYRPLGDITSHSNSLLRVEVATSLPFIVVSKFVKKSFKTRFLPKVFYVFSSDSEKTSTVAVISQRQQKDVDESLSNWRLNFYDKQLNSLEKLILMTAVLMLDTPVCSKNKWKNLLKYSTACVHSSN